jgi:NADPH:quinone reductase-like Zn-dependent oxidoreductase
MLLTHRDSGLTAAAIAKRHGCYVAATSRSSTSKEQILSNAADEFILDDGNIAETLTESTKFHKVLELIGTKTILDSLACTTQAPNELGLVCMIGMASGEWALKEFSPMEAIPQGVALTMYSGGKNEMGRIPWTEIIQDIENGVMKIQIGRRWKLEDIVDAHGVMEHGGAGGKMVIVM